MPHNRRHLRLGRYGENLAIAHLRRDGMRVLQRNWRCEHGELDIIAIERGVTVFCEVKTRRSLRFGTPMQAIDEAKALRIRRLATSWHRRYRDRPPWAEWLGLTPRDRTPNAEPRGDTPGHERHGDSPATERNGDSPAGDGRGESSPRSSSGTRPASRPKPGPELPASPGPERGPRPGPELNASSGTGPASRPAPGSGQRASSGADPGTRPGSGLRAGSGAGWLRGGIGLVGTVLAVLAWRRGGGWQRRFDVVCVVLDGDGTATIDHRRGVL